MVKTVEQFLEGEIPRYYIVAIVDARGLGTRCKDPPKAIPCVTEVSLVLLMSSLLKKLSAAFETMVQS